MTPPEPERRISIWSVPENWRRLYFAIFAAQSLALLGLAVWHEVFIVPDHTWPEAIFAIGSKAGPGIGVIAAESIILTEAYFVVIFGGIVERYQNRLKQREAEGEARGEARGEAEGEARANKKWEAWNRRRLQAEANGQAFTESPPSHQQSVEKFAVD